MMFAPNPVAVDIDECDWYYDGCMVNSVTCDAMNDAMKQHPILSMSHMMRISPICPLQRPMDSNGTTALNLRTIDVMPMQLMT